MYLAGYLPEMEESTWEADKRPAGELSFRYGMHSQWTRHWARRIQFTLCLKCTGFNIIIQFRQKSL